MKLLTGKKNYEKILRNENLRNTKHRNSILEVIDGSKQPITAETIYFVLKEQGVSISLSTVYRVLDALLDKTLIVKTSVTDDNKALYEINGMEHKHHLLCVKCRKMLSVDGCPLEEYEKALEKKLGFSIKGHKLEMFGLCENCKIEN
jgi:Fur family transcriptional regulator, ferric uptake regulator